MKVSATKPFKIVYSLYQHQYLGYLFQAFAVQADENGKLTLQHQNISPKNASEFEIGLDETDKKLIRWIDECQQENVVKRNNNSAKKMTTAEFFFKIYDPAKGDKLVQEAIENYLEKRKALILENLKDKPVFEMSNDGEPTYRKISFSTEPVSVLFKFERNATNTLYWPILTYKNKTLDFQTGNAIIPCNTPAWMLLDNIFYHFGKEMDGNKLRPFLAKKYIIVPRNIEKDYYPRFIKNIIRYYDVSAKGFDIVAESHKPTAILTFRLYENGKAHATLFENNGHSTPNQQVAELEKVETDEQKIIFELKFRYGQFLMEVETEVKPFVKDEFLPEQDYWIFHKVQRNAKWEKDVILKLINLGLLLQNGKQSFTKSEAMTWINNYYNNHYDQEQIVIEQELLGDNGKYFIGKTSISVDIKENRDWFDINAKVMFGTYSIPFIKIRRLILQKKHEFKLPNGEIAIIPDAWFAQYAELFALSEEGEEDGVLKLPRFQLALVEEMKHDKLADVTISGKLQRLRDFRELESYELPNQFKGELRPYQKAGYDWMCFLREYRFGGCLADDMGLGKTVQTLALLQRQREEGLANGARKTSLLVVPTSLIYNWEMEARKFTPELKLLSYIGTYRQKSVEVFAHCDLVISSYGIVRADTEMLAGFHFHYLILDESQAIKNPASSIAKSVLQLKASHKLILTGTPLENSTMDLWSQMNFINQGLLGSQSFFRNEFLSPIEKKNNQEKLQRLHSMIKPFILRRNKSQVATELPEKVEYIQYCNMPPEQERCYEEAKSAFRNKILDHIETIGVARSQIYLLQGLTKLRQIANHPAMTDSEFEGPSAKLTDILYKLEEILGENHKVLIFSQFVKHLTIVRKELEAKGLTYAYLDGSSTDRQEQVENFQTNPKVPIFLISLKAGGVGLNLTAADYVFILDPWWNPAVEAQAIDRAHRIGQDKKVFIYKFITRHTVEEKILLLQRSKQKLLTDLITTEETFVKTLSQDDIMSLLN